MGCACGYRLLHSLNLYSRNRVIPALIASQCGGIQSIVLGNDSGVNVNGISNIVPIGVETLGQSTGSRTGHGVSGFGIGFGAGVVGVQVVGVSAR